MSSITVTGNIGRADLKFTPAGKAVLNATVAENVRRLNKNTNAWEDVRTDWHNFSIWDEKAETLAEVLRPGVRVIVTGELGSREYEKDGVKRTAWEIAAREVGIVPRLTSGRGPQQQQTTTEVDPWATSEAPF